MPHKSDIKTFSQPPLPFLRVAFAIAGSLALTASAADWPQFLGPARNGSTTGAGLAEQWPKDGPTVLWQKKVGAGFAGPAAAGGKVFLFHRLDDKEVVDCLDAATGKAVWSFDYPTRYRDDFGFDNGPRAVPSVAGGKVFTYGADGALHGVDLATGKKVWSVDTRKEFAASKGFFGLACSPLVEGDAVIVNIGGKDGAGTVAFHKDTGKLLWKTTDDEASYSSPVAATINGRRLVFVLSRSALFVLEPGSGKAFADFPFRPPMQASVTAAAPLIVGDTVLLSANYGTGAAALRVTARGLEKLWANDETLSSQYASIVERDGFIYGLDGRVDTTGPPPSLRCVELKTGKVRWSKDRFGGGTLMLAGENLLALTEKGELVRVAAMPEGYRESSRAQVMPFVRAFPALADGRFFARSKDQLVCLDLRATKKP